MNDTDTIMGVLSLRLPDDLEQAINEEARLSGQPRSQLIREALAGLLAQRRQERHEADLVRAARALATQPEARRESLAVAEAFLACDASSPHLAEAVGASDSQEIRDQSWWR